MQKQTPAQAFKDYLLITAATLFVAFGVYFFKFPNHFSTGGVTGIAMILNRYIPSLSSGAFVFIINQALLLIGFLVFGKSFGLRTAYASLLLSCVTWGLEYIWPMSAPFTDQPLLELVFAVGLPAIGSAILFNINASSGGTDIVAMILRKFTNLNIGNALLFCDFAVTVVAGVAFGVETGLFCVLGLVLKSVIVDMVLENIKVHKCFQIITSKPEEIIRFITEEMKRGATELHGEGAYTHDEKTVILTVVSRYEAIRLRQYARTTDPSCFILIMNTGEIIGKGFRGVM